MGLAPADLTVGGMNLANQINASVGSIKTLLPGITDAASAQAALPKIKEATAQLNGVSSRATQLSPEGKSTLVKLIVVATPTINQMCDKVLATPGAGDIASRRLMSFEASSPRSRAPEFQNVAPSGLRRTAGATAARRLCASARLRIARSAVCVHQE